MFGIELPQLAGHGDWCSKIQVSIFFKIFFGLNYPSPTRFRHSNFSTFWACKKFFPLLVGRPNPIFAANNGLRPMVCDLNKLGSNKFKNTSAVLIRLALGDLRQTLYHRDFF